MSQKNNSFKAPILAVVAIFLLIIAISVIYALSDDSGSSSPAKATPVPSSPAVTSEAATESFTAVITEVNTDDSVITLCKLGENEFIEYTYTGATDIRTGYNKIISASMLRAGDFVKAECSSDRRLLSLTGSTEISIYKGVKNLVIEYDLMRMSINDEIYRYDNNLLILNDGYFVGLDTLYRTDILSVCSIDNFVYLIKVTSGHGYLKLSSDTDFVGGTMSVGSGTTVQIEENMLLTLAEGEYSVTVENNDLSGSGTIKISRDRTSIFDLSPFLPEPVEYGKVAFDISPYGALLYVDGVLTDSSEAVAVSVGEHRINVICDGYTPYEGNIYVNKSGTSLSVGLSRIPIEEESVSDDFLYSEDSYSEPESDSNYTDYSDIPDSTSDADDSDARIDTVDNEDNATANNPSDDNKSEPQMIIHCTEGAAVFIDGVYKGIIEEGTLSITKPTGTVSIRLTKEGYTTKSYTVTVEDDAADAEFTFPGMVQE